MKKINYLSIRFTRRLGLIFSLIAILILSQEPSLTQVVQANPLAQSTTYTVNSTADPGDGVCDMTECTLREAINIANASSDAVTIAFNIPVDTDPNCVAATGVCTIMPTSALPIITNPVVIDGYTQPGAQANTNPITQPINAILKIELDGSEAGNGANGLTTWVAMTVRGLTINRFAGVGIMADYAYLVVQGNFIGTDVSGMEALGNGTGVLIIRDGATIGGIIPEARNLISGNAGNGISCDECDYNIIVQGNFIGADRTGMPTLGNGGSGVNTWEGSNTIGGTTPGASNIISGNDGWAVNMAGFYDGSSINGNHISHNGAGGINVRAYYADHTSILSNAIFANGGPGIDLDGDGVTPNDLCDNDTGTNNLQNFPVLSSAESSSGETTIQGTLNSKPNLTFELEFFSNSECDPSGNGEGENLLGSTMVTTDGNCDAIFEATFSTAVPSGHFITTTGTGPNGNTSEFSNCIEVVKNLPPDCSNATPSINALWPPNHKFVPVEVFGVTDPDDDPVSITIDSIFQDEAVDAPGSGNTSPDGQGVGTSTAGVRAERVGKSNGRVYHISFTADDGRGGTCSSEVLVGVPHDKKDDPVDDGPLYDSTVAP